MKQLPWDVHAICFVGEGAWIVGSAADPLVLTVKDYDILVPYGTWNEVRTMLTSYEILRFTRWGGLHLMGPKGTVIDIWPDDLSRWFSSQTYPKHAWHPKSRTHLVCRRETDD